MLCARVKGQRLHENNVHKYKCVLHSVFYITMGEIRPPFTFFFGGVQLKNKSNIRLQLRPNMSLSSVAEAEKLSEARLYSETAGISTPAFPQ